MDETGTPAAVTGTTIFGCLERAAERDPGGDYLIGRERTWSFAEVLEAAELASRRLAGLGLCEGDPVVIWLPNGAEWVSSFYGCLRIGAPVVTANTRLRAMDLVHILADSHAVALVYAPEFLGIDFDRMAEALIRERASGRLPDLRHVISVGRSARDAVRAIDSLPETSAPTIADPSAGAVVCYTSGTTGRPKGCVHSHATLIRNGTLAAQLSGLGPGERVACPVPFAHVFGFHMGVLQCALSGAALINAEPYSAATLVDLIAVQRATVLYAVPAIAREAAAEHRRRRRQIGLRLAVVAGAPASPRLRESMLAADGLGTALSVVYGCTEAPTIAQLRPNDPQRPASSSVGRPTPGVEVRICAPGTADRMPTGEVGEILTRGYNQMLGYLGDPEATERKYRDDWLVTGDLGWLDSEGFLYFAGRADETLTIGGFTVHAREIEAQLEEVDGVGDAAVIAVPDKRLGQVPMAWVTVEGSEVSDRDVLRGAAETLASYKRPRHVRVVERLPRVASGKISRVQLRDWARRALPGLDWEDLDRGAT